MGGLGLGLGLLGYWVWGMKARLLLVWFESSQFFDSRDQGGVRGGDSMRIHASTDHY